MGMISKLLDVFFPPKCLFCRKPGNARVCAACKKKLEGQLTTQQGEFFSRSIAAMHYQNQVRDAIIRFKFQDQPGYATEFGVILSDMIREHFKGQYDLITWVPVSEMRKKKRGYDQAMLLAMAAALGLDDVAVETLRKCRHNPAQASLKDSSARRANVLGAYEVVDPELIAGKRILLIDDVITTGATLDEASRMLLASGAKEVLCAVLAHPIHNTEEESV